jgi:aspartyl-tRNA(Asn)/glutamyl-tRNA(Gln) amidotransferase subunit B
VRVDPDPVWQSEVTATVGTMPADRRAALFALLGPDGDSEARTDQIATVVEHGLDDLMTAAVSAGIAAPLALARTANEASAQPDRARALDHRSYTALLRMEQSGALSATQAKEVLTDLLDHGGDPAELARQKGFEAMSDGALAAVLDDIIAAHGPEWERFVDGDKKMAGLFTGLVMKATDKKANGKAVAAELQRRLASSSSS